MCAQTYTYLNLYPGCYCGLSQTLPYAGIHTCWHVQCTGSPGIVQEHPLLCILLWLQQDIEDNTRRVSTWSIGLHVSNFHNCFWLDSAYTLISQSLSFVSLKSTQFLSLQSSTTNLFDSDCLTWETTSRLWDYYMGFLFTLYQSGVTL